MKGWAAFFFLTNFLYPYLLKESSHSTHLLKPSVQDAHPVPTHSLGGSVLDDTSRALQASLQALSGRLTSVSSNSNALDPVSVGATADAIGKVAQALAQIRQLQSNEIHGNPITQL